MNLVGILCQDHIYNKRLSEFLMSRGKAEYCVHSFSSVEGFTAFAENTHLDLLVVDERIFYEFGERSNRSRWASHYLVLKDEIIEPTALDTDSCLICRYISSAFVLDHIRKMLTEGCNAGNRVMERSYGVGLYSNYPKSMPMYGKECCVIGIYSDVHSCGKTSLAVLLSQFLQERGNTLFIPMDYRNPVFSSADRCLVNLIYTIFRNSGSMEYRDLSENVFSEESFQSILKSDIRMFDEISYIPSSCYKEDICDIEDVHMVKLIEYLTQNTDYRFLIIDFSDVAEFRESLKLCDYILMPAKDDCFSRAYVENFKRMWKEYYEKQENVDSSENVIFKRFRFLQLPDLVRVSSPVNYYRELAWSSLAGVAKGLAEEIAGCL